MDLGSSGWFDDARMWEVMKQLESMDQEFLASPQPYRPEVAAVVNEPSMTYVAAGGSAITPPCVYEIRAPPGRMGAPYAQYLLDDVVAGRVHARLYVLANAWSLSPERRQALRAATAGATRVWCYAPGYLEPERSSVSGMRDLTGVDLALVTEREAMVPRRRVVGSG